MTPCGQIQHGNVGRSFTRSTKTKSHQPVALFYTHLITLKDKNDERKRLLFFRVSHAPVLMKRYTFVDWLVFKMKPFKKWNVLWCGRDRLCSLTVTNAMNNVTRPLVWVSSCREKLCLEREFHKQMCYLTSTSEDRLYFVSKVGLALTNSCSTGPGTRRCRQLVNTVTDTSCQNRYAS